ncbi:MAG: hypothetical protein GY711_06765 [bacterium]|nr:hypothetical protein [bacterium]
MSRPRGAAAFKVTPAGVITQLIDHTGDGVHPLNKAYDIAVHGQGNVYVAGYLTDNVFRVTPGGVITQIIDASGDGAGNVLQTPFSVAVDSADNVYVAGWIGHNAFSALSADAA